MTDFNPYLNNSEVSSAARGTRAHSIVKSAVSFVFEEKFESAAGCFEALLVLIDQDTSRMNYTQEYLLSIKFGLCCCYFYAGTDHQRNLQLLNEIQKFEDNIPAVYYITAAVLYKLNLPSLALKNVECGLYKLSKCAFTKSYFWPGTDSVIDFTEKAYLKSRLEDLKEKLQSSVTHLTSPSSQSKYTTEYEMFSSANNSRLNAAATEFFPARESMQPHNFLQQERTSLKDELNKQFELLQKIHSEQRGYSEVKSEMEAQQQMYEKKINDLEKKLEIKDQLIATLSAEKPLIQEVTDNLLASIRTLLKEQSSCEIDEIRTENIKLKNVILQLLEKYFNIQVSISNNNEMQCIMALENLNTLLKNQNAFSGVSATEIEEEINTWKTKLDGVHKHRSAAENAVRLMKGNTLEDALKLLNDLTEGTSSTAHKPDFLQQICLRKALQNMGNSSLNSTFCDDKSDDSGAGTPAKDWKYRLRKHRVTSLGLNPANRSTLEASTPERAAEEVSRSENKRLSFSLENNGNSRESWIDREISKLSERVKLIGGPNYWRLIVFIKDQLPMESEDTIVDAVEMVRASHGKLNGLSRDTIVSQAKGIILAKKGVRKSFKSEVGTRFHSSECSVCLEEFDVTTSGILTCGHQFHKACIQSWLAKEPLCPVCRAFIVPQEYNTLKSPR